MHLHRDAGEIAALKKEDGAPLLIFGSPGLTHAFMALDAIDEFWICLNPVLLGQGIRYFDRGVNTPLATLSRQKPFDNGVTRFHYAKA